MIKTTLPIFEKRIDESSKKIVTEEKEIKVAIDTSLFSEERWEANFPNNAKKETLFAYIERIKEAGLIDSRAHVLSNLKALYCFMEGEDIPDFKSFCQLFDLSDAEHMERLVNKIKFVFEIVLGSSTVASLDGLMQLHCNGNVTKAHGMLEKHLNQAAHGQNHTN